MTIHHRYSVGDIVTPNPNKLHTPYADILRGSYGLITTIDSDDVSPRLTLYGVYWGIMFAWAVSDEIVIATPSGAD